MLAARDEVDLLRRFTDFTIESDFPHLATRQPGPERYIELFTEVCRLTVDMIVHWMRVGFVHGVMNTDNMSILGLTIDYGPYGWLEDYDPDWTPNTTDAATRRYRFGHQPAVAQWNLLQLANAIYPIVGQAEPLEAALRAFAEDYQGRPPRHDGGETGPGGVRSGNGSTAVGRTRKGASGHRDGHDDLFPGARRHRPGRQRQIRHVGPGRKLVSARRGRRRQGLHRSRRGSMPTSAAPAGTVPTRTPGVRP